MRPSNIDEEHHKNTIGIIDTNSANNECLRSAHSQLKGISKIRCQALGGRTSLSKWEQRPPLTCSSVCLQHLQFFADFSQLCQEIGNKMRQGSREAPAMPSAALRGGASEALPGRAEERLIVTDGGSCHAPAKPTLAYKKKVLLKYGCENSNNILSYVWGFLGQMQIFELKHFENHYRNNLVNSRLSKRDVGSHDEASAPSSASSTCWPARMCAARSARVRRLAGGRTSWQNVAKLLQRLASFRLYPHRFLHAKRKHRRKYFMPNTKTAELTLANGL